MADYYVHNGTDDRGDHEVHREGCGWMPRDRTYLGNFVNCVPAVIAAKRIYSKSNGCIHCSPDCHTS